MTTRVLLLSFNEINKNFIFVGMLSKQFNKFCGVRAYSPLIIEELSSCVYSYMLNPLFKANTDFGVSPKINFQPPLLIMLIMRC